MNQLTMVVYVRQTNAGHREHGYTLFEGVNLIKTGTGYGPESAAHTDAARWLLEVGKLEGDPSRPNPNLGVLCRECNVPLLEISFSGVKASEIKEIKNLKTITL